VVVTVFLLEGPHGLEAGHSEADDDLWPKGLLQNDERAALLRAARTNEVDQLFLRIKV
jgi:hypothetical protein